MAMRAVWLGLVLALSAPAATAADAGDKVLQRIILVRHGIRSPTKSPADLAKFAAEPWPSWPVPPGQLTPHGIDTLHSLGKRIGTDLASAGLPNDTCHGLVRIIADSTPRNRASAEALLEGLSPSCASTYQAFPAGKDDPLFRGTGGEDDDKGRINAADITPSVHSTLAMLQRVLLGCDDKACMTKAEADGRQVLLGGDLAKALKTAGSLSENIMLGYVQGMPAAQYSWGRLDAAGVARIIGLHNASFQLAHATPEASRGRGGNMLAHITATLAATAGMQPKASPLAPAGTRVLILVGHDTDLASEAGLLGLKWHDATKGDDYPPGGALIYDLVQTTSGKVVRLHVAMPTLAALRAGDLQQPSAIASAVLSQPACAGETSCPIECFEKAAANAVGTAVAARLEEEPSVATAR